ncbi:hypothetical protein G5C51_33415 [Streptomyces sp. A7024]|uniref:Thiamine biosynthesis protein ThiC n=1 Tax=Streptomyces coryli TaxID=1128680 RepID=A0A6G4UBL9_9ACTN|nr:hypothetical protein [Streptomyces coryli]NGN68778.1 hypothetical protein [Streptomyces coryli]
MIRSSGPYVCSMKNSHDIRRDHGAALDEAEIERGMEEKSKEFAAAGNRVYLPMAE